MREFTIQDLDLDYFGELLDTLPTIKNNKQLTYVNIECGLDIETNSVYINNEKTAFMYIWVFGIKDVIIYGRTWEELQSLFELIAIQLELHKDKRLVCYIHNFSFEFQFMMKYFEWTNVFAIKERKPLKAVTDYGIEFRDSYMLSGYSLAKTAENLQSHTIEKMEGDLDYSLIRTKDTTMTDKEMGYIRNDVVIILYYINEQITQYGDLHKVPLTNTGRVRTYVRNMCYYTSTNHRKSSRGKYEKYRKIMKDLTLTASDYAMSRRAFLGGFTHANANHTGKLLKNVGSYDFTSSYPSVMLAELFPMSKATHREITSPEQFNEYIRTKHVIFDLTLHNVTSKITQENYLSDSKCFNKKNVVVNNGRIHSADTITTTVTEVDYSIIQKAYNYTKISVKNVYTFEKGYLPKAIIDSVINLYKDKTELKDVIGKETEYMLSKGMLNSIYGMTVTDIIRDDYEFSDGEWTKEHGNMGQQIDKYNDSSNRFLFYPWGIYVTAYARRNLWTGILAVGDDYVYSDTDSIKMLNPEKHLPYIEKYNDLVMKKLHLMCDFYKIDYSLLTPKTIEGVPKPIGVWDSEGVYTYFKTLGAKRYLTYKNDKLQLTVAGLSKNNGLEYLKEISNNDVLTVFENFNDKLYVPKNRTGKMTHTYIDETKEFDIVDYQGNKTHIITKSGVHLEDTDFTLNLSDEYLNFLENFIQGNIYTGESATL